MLYIWYDKNQYDMVNYDIMRLIDCIFDHSHIILVSKLDKAKPKATMGAIGAAISKLNLESETLPNKTI